MLLQNYFETRMQMIEEGILAALSFEKRYAASLKEAMHKAMIPGGKRWRPLLLISMFEMLTGHKKNHKLMSDVLHAAVAVELIHNAAIVHDDLPLLMNQAQRRAQPAIHQEYGNAIAILTADALYTLAFEEIGQIREAGKVVAATRTLATHSKSYGILGGQAVALSSQRRVMKLNTLRFIDMKKVGALLQACAELACILAESDEDTQAAMGTYAMNLGMCYQMIDDIEADYARGSEGLDFDEEYVPASKSGYTGLMGFDKAKKDVEKLLLECERIIEPYSKNDALMEFINMINERLP